MEEYGVLGFVFFNDDDQTYLEEREEKKTVTLVMERSEGYGRGKYDVLVE